MSATDRTDGTPLTGPSHARAKGIDALTAARRVVLDLLGQTAGPMTVAEVAEETGLHLNTVREHLEFLIETGLARRGRLAPVGRGRPASTYTFAPQAELLSPGYALVAGALVDYLATTFGRTPEMERHAEAVGRQWGREILARMSDPADDEEDEGGPGSPDGTAGTAGTASTDGAGQDRFQGLVDLLDTAGFDPRVQPCAQGLDVRLYRCPVLTLARSYPHLVCAAHLGLAREYLDGGPGDPADEPSVVVEAFVDPGYCRLLAGVPDGGDGLVVGEVPPVVL